MPECSEPVWIGTPWLLKPSCTGVAANAAEPVRKTAAEAANTAFNIPGTLLCEVPDGARAWPPPSEAAFTESPIFFASCKLITLCRFLCWLGRLNEPCHRSGRGDRSRLRGGAGAAALVGGARGRGRHAGRRGRRPPFPGSGHRQGMGDGRAPRSRSGPVLFRLLRDAKPDPPGPQPPAPAGR